MSGSVLLFTAIAVALLLTLAWLSLPGPRREPGTNGRLRPERESRHISYLPQIKQALAPRDGDFLAERGFPEAAKRIRKERKRISLDYLAALRMDFERLLRMAKLISVMSPELDVVQELLGVRLRAEFLYRYQMIRVRLTLGIAPAQAIGSLSDMVSGLTARLEAAMAELGERAALVAEMASPYNGGGMDVR